MPQTVYEKQRNSTEASRLHEMAIQLSSYGTVTLAQPSGHCCTCITWGAVAFDKNGLSELAKADSAGSSLKAAEPQAYGACFAKLRSVKLVCHLVQPCLVHKRDLWSSDAMVRRLYYAKFVTCLSVIKSSKLLTLQTETWLTNDSSA